MIPGTTSTQLEPGGDYIVSVMKSDAPDWQTAEELIGAMINGGANAEPAYYQGNTAETPGQYATANMIAHSDGGTTWDVELIVVDAPSMNPPQIGGQTSDFPNIAYNIVPAKVSPNPSPFPTPSASGILGWVKEHPFISGAVAIVLAVLLGRRK